MSRGRNLILFLSLVMSLAILVSCAGTGEISVLPETKIAFLSRPGVVLITAIYEGRLLDDAKEPKIHLYSNDQYFTSVDLPTFSSGGMGSGFIISGDGYIVTNAHVVYTEEDQLKQSFALQATQWAAENLPPIFQQFGVDPYPATQEELQEIFQLFMTKFTLDANREVKAFMGKSISGLGTTVKGYPAEVRKISVAQLWVTSQNQTVRVGKDVAIIKIEADNLPTVRLGDSDAVQTGDKVVAVGYPGVVVVNPFLSPESILYREVHRAREQGGPGELEEGAIPPGRRLRPTTTASRDMPHSMREQRMKPGGPSRPAGSEERQT